MSPRPPSLVLAAALLAGCSAVHAASGLVPPPGYFAAVGHGGGSSFSCPEAPAPFSETLDLPSKYEGSGKARDQLNEAADAEYKARARPINDFEKGIASIVSKYVETGKPEALRCAIDWYSAWADGHGLQGEAASFNGRAARKWALASISGAWLKLEFSSSQPLAGYAGQSAKIDEWLGKVADQVVGEWDAGGSVDKINNHVYWAAWAVMATAVALNRRDLFDWSAGIYRRFAGQVDGDGYLPNELKRATRALGYHNFALAPIAMMAAFGKANGLDLAGAGNGALARLATRTLAGMDDPKVFEGKSGFHQVAANEGEEKSQLAWLEPYCWAAGCSGAAAEKLESLRPMGNSRLGGNLTQVFAAR